MHSFEQIACICANSHSEENRLNEKHNKISKRHLINLLNYINFQDRKVSLKFRHKKYNTVISVPVRPQPCMNSRLECRLEKPYDVQKKIHYYELLHLAIDNDDVLIIVKPEIESARENIIYLNLPEYSYEINFRKFRRYPCSGINAEMIQNSVSFHGKMVDFSSAAFAVRVFPAAPQSFQWINPEVPLTAVFKQDTDIIYAGSCTIIRKADETDSVLIVLVPDTIEISRFPPKMFRSSRKKLQPSPYIVFRHPLMQTTKSMKVKELSCSDLCVEEYGSASTLFVGLILSSLDIEFAPDLKLQCRAQVVKQNQKISDQRKNLTQWEISFLDMPVKAQVQLSCLLHQIDYHKSFVCNRVDMDALWKFFFQTGFFYPEKYSSIQFNKEQFKGVYQRLYNQNPDIANHFVVQDKGNILGHIAMIRFYEKTWLIHHHAAHNTIAEKAGLVVLNQIGRYINDFSWLYSTRMQYVMCYYRPENKFPSRVFGGFEKYLNNPKKCSVDTFSYSFFSKTDLPEQHWKDNLKRCNAVLEKAGVEDIVELNIFYEGLGGGLLLDALDLKPESMNQNELKTKYEEVGLKRDKHLFSLKINDCLKAVIMLTLSDTALNLSSLTNCFHILVLDTAEFSTQVMVSALHLCMNSGFFGNIPAVPVLIFPETYATDKIRIREKSYHIWIFNIRYSDQYFQYMAKLYRGHTA